MKSKKLLNHLFIGLFFMTSPIIADKQIHIQGHRGNCALVMENLIASFLSAIRAGADSIELDVNVSKDGQLVVFHDFEFSPHNTLLPDGSPIAKKTPIIQLTVDEIRKFEINEVKHLIVPNTLSKEERRVPTLEEVFKAIANESHPNAKRIVIDVEVKSDPTKPTLSPPPAEFAKQVYEAVQKWGPPGRTVIRSFDHRILYEVRKLSPTFPIAALVWPNFPRQSWDEIATQLKPNVLAPRIDQVTTKLIKKMHRYGIQVMPFTANTQAQWDRMLNMGVDGLTGDDPKAMGEYILKRGFKRVGNPSAVFECKGPLSKASP